MQNFKISRKFSIFHVSRLIVHFKLWLIFIFILGIVCLRWPSSRQTDFINSNSVPDALLESSYWNNEKIIKEIELVNRIKRNKTLYDYLTSYEYFTCLKTDKALEKEFCQLPDLNIWDANIEKLLQRKPVFNKCRKNNPLSYIRDNCLLIDQTVKENIYPDLKVCKFAPVIRSAIKSDHYILGEFKDFSSGLPIIDDYIKVRCFSNNASLIYEYVHYIFHPVKKKLDAPSHKLNVLILIFDSVSASSFKRSLPNTFTFLKSFDNFFQFTKHHTIGQNTLPNLVPMLSGKTSRELLGDVIFPPPLDNFPFIWKNFSSSNYVTYLNEDWRNSMFNNEKFGFRRSPTDFYLRPFWLAAYDSLSSAPTKLNSNPKPCFYNKLYHHFLFDWLRTFQKIYNEDLSQNTFGIVKSNEMSHDHLERLYWIDNDLKALLKDLLTEAFLNNTLLVIMGDHGHRFHSIRHTFTGKIEEKLPFFSMMVPKMLLEKNLFLSDVLKINSQTLTTFFDVYETLLQLLIDQTNMEPSQSSYFKKKLERSSSGFSLFLPVPYRNCSQAQIPEYLCSCRVNAKVDLSAVDLKIVNLAAQFLVQHINEVLLVDYKSICVPLQFKRISDAQIVDTKLSKYSIIFETMPNGAIFDGMVVHSSRTNRFKLIGLISRVNLYGHSSKCVQSYFLKNYCFCKSF